MNANSAAGYQLATGEPVMAIGGFNGTDPAPTLAQFEQYVSEGKIHYYIAGGGGFGGFGGRAGWLGGRREPDLLVGAEPLRCPDRGRGDGVRSGLKRLPLLLEELPRDIAPTLRCRPDFVHGMPVARETRRFATVMPSSRFQENPPWFVIRTANLRRSRRSRVPGDGPERSRRQRFLDPENAELVAFGIGEHDPRLLSLAHIGPRRAESEQSLDLPSPVVGPKSRCRRFFAVFGSGTSAKSRPGSRSGAGRISYSSGSSLTTTQPSASAHHLPRPTGSRASTMVCSHSRLTAPFSPAASCPKLPRARGSYKVRVTLVG